VTVEIRTVNHRFIDCSIRLPRALNGFEIEAERMVRRKIKRGHVYVTVSLDDSLGREAPVINKTYLERLYEELSGFAEEHGISGEVDLNTLLMMPEAVVNKSEMIEPGEIWPSVKKALGEALTSCTKMRRAEGEELSMDIGKRLTYIEGIVGRIEKKAPAALKRALAATRNRFKRLLDGMALDEERWAIEAAIMADRTDFSEELVRLKSHLGQFRSVLAKGGEVSKKLTFILQEMHRETTTMGNKSADAKIIENCLSIKEAVEKIREQAQNLE